MSKSYNTHLRLASAAHGFVVWGGMWDEMKRWKEMARDTVMEGRYPVLFSQSVADRILAFTC